MPAASALSQTVLFDATKAEMAANADWVIDADLHNLTISSASYGSGSTSGSGTESNPQRIPTPAATGISAATSETYWAGAISSWGVTAVQQGYSVETLPYNGAITYGNSSNPQDLSHYSVYVMDEPNILFTSAEKTAILNYVAAGGGLILICDHADSDRNNDGKDSVDVLTDLFTNNGIVNNPFGITVNAGSNLTLDSTAVDTSAADPITHGPYATATHLAYNNGSSLSISTTANSSVKAAVWQTSSKSSSAVFAAYATYGLGRVLVEGDSSPADDGTGDPNDTSLYPGWITDGGAQLFTNATIWASHAATFSANTGNWSTASNWYHSTLPDSGANVYLAHNTTTTGARTVTYDYTGSPITLASLTLAAPPGSSFTLIQSQGTLTTQTESIGASVNGFTGSASISQSGGTHSVTGSLSLGLVAGSTGVYILSSSALLSANTVTLGGTPTTSGGTGTLSLTGSSIATISSLKIYPASSLSLTTNATLLLNYTGSPTTSLDTLRTDLYSYLITSPNIDPTHRLAYIDVALLPTTSPRSTTARTYADSTTIVLALTLSGDINFDGKIDADDYAILDKNFAKHTTDPHWSDGDFNYDGSITSADYLLIDRAFAQQGPLAPEFLSERESEFGSAYVTELLASLPEPSLAAVLIVLPIVSRKRQAIAGRI
ncbi:MAG TPA: dockerin type I repeat-containing protein [Tepidisphaeraceae bacterium]|nr:dockerin type I repeat-containing protein [Tepidisphaeraceae bacterium]